VARCSGNASIETVKQSDDNRRDLAGEVAELVSRNPADGLAAILHEIDADLFRAKTG